MKILVVDDSRIIRARLKMLLKSGGYSDLFFAASAYEAYEYLGMNRPGHTGEKIDLILMDIQMPETDGIEACSRIKSVEHLEDIPVIMVTGDTSEESLQSAFEAGAMDYIVKPVRKTELFARVRSLLKLKHETDKRKAHERNLIHEIEERKRAEEIVRKTNEELAEANTRIIDSIRYAEMIQQSLLPNPEEVKTYLPDSFFIWEPRDIVGGDIFFTECFEDGIVIAVVDCTGHGIPGAFMTMIASSALRTITKTEQCHDPSEILKRLNFIIKTSLQQDTAYALSDDGLDAAICFVSGQWSLVDGPSSVERHRTADNGLLTFCDKPSVFCQLQETTENSQLIYAGARLPLIYISNGEVNIIKGDRQSIGYKKSDLNFRFQNYTVTVERGISFYLFSDGFADQLGGKRMRKFGSKRLRNLLAENAQLPFQKQRELILEAFNKYKGENERQDDVTVIGFGFNSGQ